MSRLQRVVFGIFTLLLLFQIGSFGAVAEAEEDYIKWVDFTVSYSALAKAMEMDISSYDTDLHIDWISLLAYLGGKYGGDFKKYRESDLKSLVQALHSGEKLEDLTASMTHFDYYYEAYSAVLGGFLGEYSIEVPGDSAEDAPIWETRYGLKCFSPIANGFPFTHFDDFGAGRSYGFRRKHLGHDMFGQVGTPIIAVESGVVECMGWNQYGGWRIGIRSFDGKRYYYYAHLRQNRPYQSELAEGKIVRAGDVIGYMGRTGYSQTENVNNIKESHLHFGMQLIFHPSQKEGNNEIWIDVYALVRLLQKNKSRTYRVAETKEHHRQFAFDEPILHKGLVPF